MENKVNTDDPSDEWDGPLRPPNPKYVPDKLCALFEDSLPENWESRPDFTALQAARYQSEDPDQSAEYYKEEGGPGILRVLTFVLAQVIPSLGKRGKRATTRHTIFTPTPSKPKAPTKNIAQFIFRIVRK